MAETVKQQRERLTRERKEREAAKAAEAEKAAKAKKPKKTEPGLLDRIRAAFSSQDDIDRIEAAVGAMETGIDDANTRKKK